MTMTQEQLAIQLARRHGVLRASDLDAHGIPRVTLSRLCRRGALERVGRGLYVIPGAQLSEHRSIAEASRKVPNAVVCLLSALRLHQITTQMPHEVWLAIGPKDWKPKLDYPALRVVRFSGDALSEGVETRMVDGVPVRVYGVAKTVADCFKYRNKIGLDVSLEALREAWTGRRATVDELWRSAKVCRVAGVMRPYLEALQ
jgi:predicted transcriptional regulator of viral defense system